MFDKLFFYLTNDQLWAYRWRGGALSPGRQFLLDADGPRALAAWLADSAGAGGAVALGQPACMIVDVIEEDFQCHLMPHVGGRAGRALLARKLGQLYRDTPYRHAQVQNRDTEGRRDDWVLFSALTNAATVQPWLQVLEQQRVALTGLYSITLLSAALVRRLKLEHKHLLLVTQQSGGLRESFFRRGQLQFSRLTPSVAHDGVPTNVATETEKTRQFLTNTRQLARGTPLHAVILEPAGQIARLVALCQNSGELIYHFLELETASAQVGIASDPPLLEQLLLERLARHARRSHYALGRYGRFYNVLRARVALYGASAALAAAAVLWTGANLWGTWSASTDSAELQAQSARIEQGNRALRATLPPSVAKSDNLKAAVLIDQLVTQRGPMPAPLLAKVSAALERVPQINLVLLDWEVKMPGAAGEAPADLAAVPEGQVNTTPISSRLVGLPGGAPQSLRIEAEVMLPPTDYRSVLDSMNSFAQELARQPGMRVEIEQPPVDVRPSMKLSGKAGTDTGDNHAKFILRLLWQA